MVLNTSADLRPLVFLALFLSGQFCWKLDCRSVIVSQFECIGSFNVTRAMRIRYLVGKGYQYPGYHRSDSTHLHQAVGTLAIHRQWRVRRIDVIIDDLLWVVAVNVANGPWLMYAES